MLVEFQQALADLTASPELCVRVRRDPSILHRNYELTEREWRRLVGIVRHPGMACACMVYRANRLARPCAKYSTNVQGVGRGVARRRIGILGDLPRRKCAFLY